MTTKQNVLTAIACVVATGVMHAPAFAAPTEESVTEASTLAVPGGPWPAGDQRGMANTLGAGTWMRCAYYMSQPGAKSYELSHVRSNDMTQSPFGAPLVYEYRPTASVPYSKHAFNGEHIVSGEPGAQGTQMDALGHFAYLQNVWTPDKPIPVDEAKYYGGYGQIDVKPTPDCIPMGDGNFIYPFRPQSKIGT